MEGVGEKAKKIQAREGDWKKHYDSKKSRKKIPAEWIALHLNGNLAITLYCSFNFLVMVESPFT